ncbi:MAG: hypothetical protein K8R59_07435 [Thermoanaerobaculales bacterium]|nr:hypothetical protein [Thermoanaerobaculales bacterium]
MTQFPEEFDSIFRYIEVISQRAEQLINGARTRTDSRAVKLTLQARDDVDAGAVAWRTLTQEELDAKRQEMAEQFRAEMAGEASETGDGDQAVPDVLPTSTKVPVTAEIPRGDKDEELDRLQRLLGMIGVPTPDGADGADEAGETVEEEVVAEKPDTDEDSGEKVDEED